MTHDDYYKSLPDYEDIAPYLEEDPIGFEPSITIQPFAADFSTTIVIDNVPIVDPDRAVKLKKLMLKLYSAVTTDITDTDLYFPFDSQTNMTPGYVNR